MSIQDVDQITRWRKVQGDRENVRDPNRKDLSRVGKTPGLFRDPRDRLIDKRRATLRESFQIVCGRLVSNQEIYSYKESNSLLFYVPNLFDMILRTLTRSEFLFIGKTSYIDYVNNYPLRARGRIARPRSGEGHEKLGRFSWHTIRLNTRERVTGKARCAIVEWE